LLHKHATVAGESKTLSGGTEERTHTATELCTEDCDPETSCCNIAPAAAKFDQLQDWDA
jgi:hypothetical protein